MLKTVYKTKFSLKVFYLLSRIFFIFYSFAVRLLFFRNHLTGSLLISQDHWQLYGGRTGGAILKAGDELRDFLKVF